MTLNQEKIFPALANPNQALYIKTNGELGVKGGADIKAIIPAIPVAAFGDPAFKTEYNLKYAYVGGAMVGGISSRKMLKTLAEGGCLGIFGASGLTPPKVEDEVAALNQELNNQPFGSCLIHTPHDPLWEEKVVEIYLKHGIRVVEASAFVQITPQLVRYRLKGVTRRPDGSLNIPNHILAKVSRLELARRFFSPPPEKMVKIALEQGWITPEEAALAPYLPMAGDLTAEADSGGHTDFRPALTLWPAMVNAAKEFNSKHKYQSPLRVGAAGGIGTPWALLTACEVGAAYFVTGSINQACLESGLAPAGRELLAKASQADVVQGPAADMFELGAKVQVLKFGTLYAMRAQKLAEAYKQYASLEEIPAAERDNIETQIFKQPLTEIWAQTQAFFIKRDPVQAERAAKDPKFKMALVFRWYLGQTSRWAISGAEDRRPDWQIFCGPAMGAFNEWAKGTVYEQAENRRVMDLALNLFYGAAILRRQNLAVAVGLLPFDTVPVIKPQPFEEIKPYIQPSA